MRCDLYFNKSDDIVLNKTLELITANLDVEFLDQSSVINPTLKMQASNGVLNANYLFLEDLHRYYYVKEPTLENGYVIVNCHVDVLMSVKDELMKENAIIERAEQYYNIYLDDPEFKLYQPTAVSTYNFPNGFDKDAQTFLLTVVGDTSSSINESEVSNG